MERSNYIYLEVFEMKNWFKDVYEEYEDYIKAYAVFGGLGVVLTALTALAHFGVKKALRTW